MQGERERNLQMTGGCCLQTMRRSKNQNTYIDCTLKEEKPGDARTNYFRQWCPRLRPSPPPRGHIHSTLRPLSDPWSGSLFGALKRKLCDSFERNRPPQGQANGG